MVKYFLLSLMALSLVGCSNKKELEKFAINYCKCRNSTVFLVNYFSSSAVVYCANGSRFSYNTGDFVAECK